MQSGRSDTEAIARQIRLKIKLDYSGLRNTKPPQAMRHRLTILNLIFTLIPTFSTLRSFSQTNDTLHTEKHLARLYTGGRSRYSKVFVRLYADSTFKYSNWYHFGQLDIDTGRYLLTDSTLTLYSQGYLIAQHSERNPGKFQFSGQTYKLQKNTLCLFTEKQQKESGSDFYQVYFTLRRRE